VGAESPQSLEASHSWTLRDIHWLVLSKEKTFNQVVSEDINDSRP